jgi:hypothetical protein
LKQEFRRKTAVIGDEPGKKVNNRTQGRTHVCPGFSRE